MEKPTIEPDADRKHTPSFWGFTLWPAVVLMLYVLSYGPVDLFLGTESTPLRQFYSPIGWACLNVPGFSIAFNLYMCCWEPGWGKARL
jgi:hypothetical protein